MTRKKGWRKGWASASAIAVMAVCASQAGAATYTVTRHDDPTPNKCKPSDCSLREAIRAANEVFSRDTIQLGKGTYDLEIPPAPVDPAVSDGDLDVHFPIILRGQGPKNTKIDGNGLDRPLFLTDDSVDPSTTIVRDLTVKGGDAALKPMATATLGGGIWAFSSGDTLKLVNIALRKNNAQFGGGLRAQYTNLIVKRSTIAGNTATEGAGINMPSALFEIPHLQVIASTISGNAATKGGGLLADGFSSAPSPKRPEVDVVNSTVAANKTGNEGSGLFADNGATMSLDNTTVAYNQGNVDNSGGGIGGAILQNSGALFSLGDSIVAANTVGTGATNPDCAGSFSGSGNVTTGSSVDCSGLLPGPNLFVGGAQIGPLKQNGGPTRTIALQASSPALGFADTCPGKDQRGENRPPVNCDSGSYERKGS